MDVIAVLKRVKFKQLLRILGLGLRYSRFVFPTIAATKQCIQITTELYGNAHHKNGPANAFRHGLWNYMIAKKCYQKKLNVEKVIRWTKQVTDWHEESFPNRPLAKAMDLHNNKIGRHVFLNHIENSTEIMIELFIKKTKSSVFVESILEIEAITNEFVHIIK